ncbi:MAG: hypothetical protein K2N26_00285 [Oscillospiraceae bacterium]|nr:hypothetical protein [Oscillospiraceae bacterium]
MLTDYEAAELWDMIWLYTERAFEAFTQKSVILLIIQGVLIVFSFWDGNGRFFAVLSAVGLYSVYGSISVWVSVRQMELAAKRLSEIKRRQFMLALDVRHKNIFYSGTMFIPEENGSEDNYQENICLKYTISGKKFERNYSYV